MIGSIVELKRPMLGNQAGARGVVFNTYRDFDDKGTAVQVIFENGEYDGFSVDDQEYLDFVHDGFPHHKNYVFRNVMQVSDDFRHGKWNDAFLFQLNTGCILCGDDVVSGWVCEDCKHL